jgi:hypothetical protein
MSSSKVCDLCDGVFIDEDFMLAHHRKVHMKSILENQRLNNDLIAARRRIHELEELWNRH